MRIARRVVLPVLVLALAGAVGARVPAASQCTSPIVLALQGDGQSRDVSLSGDGRFTAFSSGSTNFVPADTNGVDDIFVYDRQTCAMERISVSSGGTQADAASRFPSISNDGQMVAFASQATNLAGATDTGTAFDVFLRDRQAGTTIRLTNAAAGGEPNGDSSFPSVSGDGLTVAYHSWASNLIPTDTNLTSDLFVWAAGATTRVSVASGGTEGLLTITPNPFPDPGVSAFPPAISNDGRYVAFTSAFTNLISNDANGFLDVFLHDRQNVTTTRVSLRSDTQEINGESFFPSISGDGRYVAFTSNGSNVVLGDTNFGYDTFVRDTATGTTTRVSLMTGGGQIQGGVGLGPAISGDGRYVAFESWNGTIVPGDTNGGIDVFVHDRQLAITRRVSTTAGGEQGNSDSTLPVFSEDGIYVGFESLATNLGAIPDPSGPASDAYSVQWQSLSSTPNVDVVADGTFATGSPAWQAFATPDNAYIDFNVTNGVLQFNRLPAPPGQSSSAVILQNTGAQLMAGAPIVATFQLGNSSTARRRISVLLHDQDFSDLSVCTFWLPPGSALQTYTMRTHTTEFWAGATISFYAATEGVDGGFNRVDNVTLAYAPNQSNAQTDCVDPLQPASPAGPAGPELITNGDFSVHLGPWATFGQIEHQTVGEVFEFYRPSPGTEPAGVILQPTATAAAAGDRFTAYFALGNSSSVRKRVSVILHDLDFSDLTVCTFWLAPGQPLSPYAMQGYATQAWSNTTLSIYAATPGNEAWIRLDNVSLKKTPEATSTGTECFEPGSVQPNPPTGSASTVSAGASSAGPPPAAAAADESLGVTLEATTGRVVTPAIAVDLTQTVTGTLSFESRFAGSDSRARVEISLDGGPWQMLSAVPASDDWLRLTFDLSPYAGHAVRVRLVLDADARDTGHARRWQIRNFLLTPERVRPRGEGERKVQHIRLR